MTDALHIRGRWVTMLTASRCVHHVSLADSCAPCGLTGRLEDFSDAALLAECERRRLFAPVPLKIAELRSEAGLTAPEKTPAEPKDLEPVPTPTAVDLGAQTAADRRAEKAIAEKPTPPERPAKKGRK